MILVSACLFGLNCRFDGQSKINSSLLSSLRDSHFLPFCPEQIGGLPTPRNRAWIIHGDGRDVLAGRSKVIDEAGNDVTTHFIKGAIETEKLITFFHVKKAYLKSKSPSCGIGKIYRNEDLVTGDGVCAALLIQKNVELISI